MNLIFRTFTSYDSSHLLQAGLLHNRHNVRLYIAGVQFCHCDRFQASTAMSVVQ